MGWSSQLKSWSPQRAAAAGVLQLSWSQLEGQLMRMIDISWCFKQIYTRWCTRVCKSLKWLYWCNIRWGCFDCNLLLHWVGDSDTCTKNTYFCKMSGALDAQKGCHQKRRNQVPGDTCRLEAGLFKLSLGMNFPLTLLVWCQCGSV